MLPHQRFVDHLLHALLQVKIMGYARGLLQQAAVVATSPVSAPIPSDAVNGQQVTHGGATPDSPSDSSSASPFYVNSHFSPTMIIILVILLSSFFFMGLFAVYVRRCTSEEGVSRRGSSRRIVRRDDLIVGSGVNPLLVESYPMVSYAAAKKKGCYECSVCLGDFEAGEQLKQLPKCKHVFHPGCIGLWLESHTTCPLCRRSLVNSDRWSMSFRWGGSSRGASLSTRRSGEESSRSRIGGGETAGSRWGRAGSCRGWFGRNEDASSRSRGDLQHETTTAHIVDTNDVESQALPTTSPALSSLSSSQHGPALSSQHGLQASAQLSEVAQCGLAASVLSSEEASVGHAAGVLCNPSMQASSVSSELMPCGIQECCVCSDLMPPAEVAEAANAVYEPRKPRQTAVLQWRRKLSRSNSTGHSLRRRAALQATGCMPFSLNRSRSVGRDGGDEEEVMCATPEHGPVSGSSCTTSQI